MGTASLEALTNELFDMVVQHLELGDIRNLRLVSKATCSKATQDKFVSYMLKKHVNLTQEDLEIFERMTSQGYRLGCLVRHLILVGVQYDTSMLEETVNTGFQTTKFSCGPMSKKARVYQCSDEELDYFRESRDQLRRLRRDDDGFRDAGKDLVLLSQSLQNIARHATKGLDTLSLQVVVYNTDIAIPKSTIQLGNRDRQEFFQTAERTFVLVASALWESSLSVRRFEVFDTMTDSLTSRLPYDTFNQLNWSSPGHDWSSFRAIKTLSLSLADRLMPTDFDASALDLERAATPQTRLSKKELERELSIDDLHSVSLVNMQSLCTNLEELRITWYRIFPNESTWECQRRYPGLMARRHTASGRTWQHTNGKPQWMARQLYMHHLARASPFPHLRVFHLGGLSVHAEDLCKFVEKSRPTLQEVSLDNVQAVDSKFTSLFALLAHPNSMIKRIRLEDLHENLDILHYSKEQESQCTRVSGLYYETNFIERWGEDVKRQIEYFTRDVRYSGTKENWYADKDKRAKFGSHYAGMPEVAQDL